jgi:hypothetical protein
MRKAPLILTVLFLITVACQRPPESNGIRETFGIRLVTEAQRMDGVGRLDDFRDRLVSLGFRIVAVSTGSRRSGVARRFRGAPQCRD